MTLDFDSQIMSEWYQRAQKEILEDLHEEILSDIDFDSRSISAANPSEIHKSCLRDLLILQMELVKLQEWIVEKKLKIIIVFEGRDAAGKGGIIKRIAQRLNPRVCKVVALPPPTPKEKGQWYFQRYIAHLPSEGEMVLFDRSWYSRVGVEVVMGFCTEKDRENFFQSAPAFEKMLIDSGVILIKYWLSVSESEQRNRFLARIHDPLRRWKLSSIDLESVRNWDLYTKAKELMFQRTHTIDSPWWIVESDDKRASRLNCISHILTLIPYSDIANIPIRLPEKNGSKNFRRQEMPDQMFIPRVY